MKTRPKIELNTVKNGDDPLRIYQDNPCLNASKIVKTQP